jgi:hypothetical protein
MRDIIKDFKRMKKLETRNRDKEMESGRKVILPCIKGTTNRITKVLRRKHIKIIFSPLNFLRNMLDKAKDPVDPKMRKGVYSIHCSCIEVYIVDIGRLVKVRLKECCKDIIYNRTKKVVVVEHSHKSNHNIHVEDVKVTVMEEHYNMRCICKALEIEKHPWNFNMDDGLVLSESWKPLIHTLKNNLTINNNQVIARGYC